MCDKVEIRLINWPPGAAALKLDCEGDLKMRALIQAKYF